MGQIAERRVFAENRIATLQAQLKKAEGMAAGKACIYITGSYGRLEACEHSDLDLFILGKSDGPGPSRRILNSLDEICIKADLIDATRSLGIQEFSGDGKYLVHYHVRELIETLGTSEDDAANTFTARLLLLLESRPLLESSVYHEVTKEIIAVYWGDYERHRNDFMPAFLANDILRLWRTFCVNYEARTKKEPEKESAKRKLKNYKLKHSRLLTCYSALLYLLAVYGCQKTVSPADVIVMIGMTPTERLQWLLDQPTLCSAHPTISSLLEQYESFLAATNLDSKELITRFLDKKTSEQYMSAAHDFGELVFKALMEIGKENRFQRLLIV